MSWVVGVTDLAAIEQRLGRPAASGHRGRPDGYDLRWRQIGINETANDPSFPGSSTGSRRSPSTRPPAAARFGWSGSTSPATGPMVVDYLGEEGHPDLDDLQREWLPVEDNDDETGVVAAHFTTPHGVSVID